MGYSITWLRIKATRCTTIERELWRLREWEIGEVPTKHGVHAKKKTKPGTEKPGTTLTRILWNGLTAA